MPHAREGVRAPDGRLRRAAVFDANDDAGPSGSHSREGDADESGDGEGGSESEGDPESSDGGSDDEDDDQGTFFINDASIIMTSVMTLTQCLW